MTVANIIVILYISHKNYIDAYDMPVIGTLKYNYAVACPGFDLRGLGTCTL